MALRLVTADERLADNKATVVIFGRPKIGKTSLLYTMPEESTLFLNLEAGMKSVQGWRGLSVDIGNWTDAVDMACLIAGVDPSAVEMPLPDAYTKAATAQDALNVLHNNLSAFAYTPSHYNVVKAVYGNAIPLANIRSVFMDSISDLTRLAMTWAKAQPEAFSEKTGKADVRGAYGLLGREAVRMLRHVQKTPAKNIIFVGGLERRTDDIGRESFVPQTEGGKTADGLPFIVDNIVTMSDFDFDAVSYAGSSGFNHAFGKGAHRAFVCRSPNVWGLPAGDRSGNLEIIEQPHLGRLIEKINAVPKPPAQRFHYDVPAQTDQQPAVAA